MNSLERPVFVKTIAPRNGVPPDGTAYFELKNVKDGSVSKIDLPVWINKVDFVKNGMSWFTHRRVFRQLEKLGMTPKTLHVNLHGGVRIFSHSTHHSFLKVG